jgi:hypothetical protein
LGLILAFILVVRVEPGTAHMGGEGLRGTVGRALWLDDRLVTGQCLVYIDG